MPAKRHCTAGAEISRVPAAGTAGRVPGTVEQRETESNQKLVFAATVLLYTAEPESWDESQADFFQNSAAVMPLNRPLREDFIMALSYSTDFWAAR